MREGLQPYIGQRITVTGRVQRFGTRPGWNGSKLPTLLVGPVLDAQGTEITDHLWIRIGRRIALADPQPGDLFTWTGTVRTYTRRRKPVGPGPALTERDLGLAYPARCAVVKADFVPQNLAEQPENVGLTIQNKGATVAHSFPGNQSADSALCSGPESAKFADLPKSTPFPARARLLFALAVLSLEEPGPISLTKLNARAGVPPIAFLAQLKKLGSAGIVTFTPTGRVLLTTQPNTSAMGVAQ